MEQDKQAFEEQIWVMQKDLEEVETKKEQEWCLQTWENNAIPEG